jgi:DNA-binding response OmpR family regulator
MTSKSILLVCCGRSDVVENRLRRLGGVVTKVSDGRSAVSLIRRHTFDAAVLISTGTEMDITETALNLRDVSPLMPIFILVDKMAARRKRVPISRAAELIPKTITLQITELARYLEDTGPPSASLKGSVRTTPS